jgi:hypothetical protein
MGEYISGIEFFGELLGGVAKLKEKENLANQKKQHQINQDINCTCGKKVAEKADNKVKIKCVKCKQVVEV